MSDEGHECNAGCRGGEHCALFWTPEDFSGVVAAANRLAARRGLRVRFVRAERAREAPPFAVWKAQKRDRELMTFDDAGIGRADTGASCPRVPVLLFWRRLEREAEEQGR